MGEFSDFLNYVVLFEQILLTSLQAMGTWGTVGVVGAAAVAGVAILCNLPTNPFVRAPQKATLEYLEQTQLQTFGSEPKHFQVDCKVPFCFIVF
ncbi:peroxiredoxin-like 2A [Aplysia californica]|uniref:Peroxiredoxin-like 2A n=1 Tax=Aplysia californica TaxID=6500 RepID=A0ABM1VT08_APLCA|nr:peroxiredoxin-like 2A [Aplysia californica]